MVIRVVPVRVLALFAHPLDVTTLAGGTLARYASTGCEVIALSATRGEAAPYRRAVNGGDDPGALRAGEWRAAARALGIRDAVVLDYADGGLSRLEPEILEDLFTDVIRAVQPDVVVTAGPGSPADPDQQAVQAAAAAAFFTVRTLAASVSSPAKLYFTLWPEQHARRALRVLQARQVPTQAIPGVSGPPDRDAAVSTIIDVRASLERKLAAVRAHASQLDPAIDGIDPNLLDDLWGQEFFVRAFPHPWISGVIERDLLAGLPATRLTSRLAS